MTWLHEWENWKGTPKARGMVSQQAQQQKVLVLGSGAREHALAWKLSQSPQVSKVYLAGGNDGMDPAWERWPFKGNPSEFHSLAQQCLQNKIDLAVIGPDNPLADGIADVFKEAGVLTFGPSAAAARLEASKAFAKDVMQSAGVPTAEYRHCKSLEEARNFVNSVPWGQRGWVVKADGLALGKGVVVCSSPEEALQAVDSLFPVSGSLVIEERLSGRELSWIALCDGSENLALLEPARDFKALLDGNQGPNTGGMGCYSPVPEVMSQQFFDRVKEKVMRPVLRELLKRGIPFCGALYAGLMFDENNDDLKVLEFNARFGDPETQVLLPRIKGDLYPWLKAAAQGKLNEMGELLPFSSQTGVYVVAAAPGYPQTPLKNISVEGFSTGKEGVFVAGLSRQSGKWLTSGGRVFGALGLGSSAEAARQQAYQRLQSIQFENMHFRKDIGEGLS